MNKQTSISISNILILSWNWLALQADCRRFTRYRVY